MPRNADVREPAPQGEGAIVLDFVLARIGYLRSTLPEQAPPELQPLVDQREELQWVSEDLVKRAEMGKEKYGTYLRMNNGRDAAVDLLQELYDAVMYSAQCAMEGKPEGSYLTILISLARQCAASVQKRTAEQMAIARGDKQGV